ncbi:MAG: hypothetical protein ACFFAL_05925 [Promethearchaeota archaeon]
MTVIGVHELPEWFAERTSELLSNYRLDIQKQLDRIDEALEKTVETSDALLDEVVVDGELTVPGSAQKLASRLKSSAKDMAFPEEITYSSVEELLDDLEDYLQDTTHAGRRYIPRLPRVHKKTIKELDYQFRSIGQGYQKIKKIWEKEKLAKQVESIGEEVEEIDERSRQVLALSEQLAKLREQKEQTAGRVEEQQEGIEQFRMDSGLAEIDGIRKEIDSIRMIVTNQLNFLKKPFKKLGQAAGQSIMISSVAGEGADAYSKEPWTAFQRDTDDLERLKAGLTALADAIQNAKMNFKASLNRKVLDRKIGVVEKGDLDEYRLRFSSLASRKVELEDGVSSDERRDLEKSLERAEWEHRDVKSEIAHIEEQVARITARLKTLQKHLESGISKLVRNDIEIEFPDEVQALLA